MTRGMLCWFPRIMSEVACVLGKEGADFLCLLWDNISITGYVLFGCDEVGTSV